MSTERKSLFDDCFEKVGEYKLILKSGAAIDVSRRTELWKDKFNPPNYWATFDLIGPGGGKIDVRYNEIGAIIGEGKIENVH